MSSVNAMLTAKEICPICMHASMYKLPIILLGYMENTDSVVSVPKKNKTRTFQASRTMLYNKVPRCTHAVQFIVPLVQVSYRKVQM
jgi:hypothetical protein